MTRKNGFTLIELSIVLVIIGLITGGILVGQSLIRGSEIRSVVTEVGRYTQAVTDFRDKYMALPGDFAGAEALWGSDVSCPNTPYTALPHTATCNGNGDGHVTTWHNNGPDIYEAFRFWQHLSNAGMIDGAYSGVSSQGDVHASTVGVNTPASKLDGAGWMFYYNNVTAGNAQNWPENNHIFWLFGSRPSLAVVPPPVLTPQEALSLDTKMDDGLPASGNVMTMKSTWWPNCTTSDNATLSHYNTAYQGIGCGLLFLTNF